MPGKDDKVEIKPKPKPKVKPPAKAKYYEELFRGGK